MDGTTMTCADLMAMDAQGMSSAGIAMKQAMSTDATVTSMTDEAATTAAQDACKAHPDGTVMDAMKAGKM
ncbi:HdeA/HdeB family chaperone [Cypionkella sp.]|nr:HdeA/HdeB family chaperone [Cypionkella sp.]